MAFAKKNNRTGALECAGVHLVTNSAYPGEALISFGFPAVPPKGPPPPPLHADTIIAHWLRLESLSLHVELDIFNMASEQVGRLQVFSSLC